MIPNPQIDPILIRLGPLAIRWYGLMYVLGLIGAFFIIKTRAAREHITISLDDLHDLILYAAIGVILGGRLGYTLFYNLPYYVENPSKLLAVWEGGMSFHGGLIGVIIAVGVFCYRKGYRFYTIADLATPAVPIGLGLGRLGNFINGELFGRPTDVPWCMVFDATGGGPLCRHPSQLYEAFFEGVVLFAILWFVRTRTRQPNGMLTGIFFVCYAIFRIVIEYFREPDATLIGPFTRGQFFSFFLIAIGIGFMAAAKMRSTFPRKMRAK